MFERTKGWEWWLVWSVVLAAALMTVAMWMK
jgi:hypothetical protein